MLLQASLQLSVFCNPWPFPEIMSASLRRWIRVVRTDSREQAQISGRKIYILPTRYGFLFGILLILLLIGSINYANNPAFLLTFLLTGMFMHAIFHTWRNLYQLQIRSLGSEPVFATETAEFRFRLSDPGGRAHFAIQLSYAGETPAISDCTDEAECTLSVPCSTSKRGLLLPGRLTLETRYPLGLLRAWSYLDSEAQALVYPRPWVGALPEGAPEYQDSQTGDRGAGSDDFVGHRGYHQGDQPRHIDWKAYAKDKGLLIKQFGGDRVDLLWLDFSQLEARDTEARLSILCGAIINLSEQALQYGLRLPGVEIAPGSGPLHAAKCLSTLALHGLDPLPK